jgi:SPP1 gp7 family putative phage head morphogenesis protein
MRAIPALPPINVLKKMWIEKNVKLIKSIPADALSRVSDVVHESIKAGESMQSLSTKLVHVFKISQTNAKRIARDQMAKLKGDLNRHNDLTHGFTSYEWSSCKDSAVRVSHEVMEGKICSWTDPTIYKNKITDNWKKRSSIGGVLKHIGADYQCRCTNIVLQERLVHEH